MANYLRISAIILCLYSTLGYQFNNIFKHTLNKKWVPVNYDEEQGYNEYMKLVEKDNYYYEKINYKQDKIKEMIIKVIEPVQIIEQINMIQHGEVPIID
jgi:hypothetical protein|tara:strand:+ start:4338 stop:4634 length:297 start_codon:yes stop_codon:yes gene_type:complete